MTAVTKRDIPLEQRQALTIEEAGALLGIGRSKAYQLVKSGFIPTVRIGNLVRVPRRALEQLVERA